LGRKEKNKEGSKRVSTILHYTIGAEVEKRHKKRVSRTKAGLPFILL